MNTTIQPKTFRPTKEVSQILEIKKQQTGKNYSEIVNEMILEAFNTPKPLPKELEDFFSREVTKEEREGIEEFDQILKRNREEQWEMQKKRDERLEKLFND